MGKFGAWLELDRDAMRKLGQVSVLLESAFMAESYIFGLLVLELVHKST